MLNANKTNENKPFHSMVSSDSLNSFAYCVQRFCKCKRWTCNYVCGNELLQFTRSIVFGHTFHDKIFLEELKRSDRYVCSGRVRPFVQRSPFRVLRCTKVICHRAYKAYQNKKESMLFFSERVSN